MSHMLAEFMWCNKTPIKEFFLQKSERITYNAYHLYLSFIFRMDSMIGWYSHCCGVLGVEKKYPFFFL